MRNDTENRIDHVRLPLDIYEKIRAAENFQYSAMHLMVKLIAEIKREDNYFCNSKVITYKELNESGHFKSGKSLKEGIDFLVSIGAITFKKVLYCKDNLFFFNTFEYSLTWNNPKNSYIAIPYSIVDEKFPTMTPAEIFMYIGMVRQTLNWQENNQPRTKVQFAYWHVKNYLGHLCRSSIKKISITLNEKGLLKYSAPDVVKNGNFQATYEITPFFFQSEVPAILMKHSVPQTSLKNELHTQNKSKILKDIKFVLKRNSIDEDLAVEIYDFFQENPRSINPKGALGEEIQSIPAVLEADIKSPLRIYWSRFQEWRHEKLKNIFKQESPSLLKNLTMEIKQVDKVEKEIGHQKKQEELDQNEMKKIFEDLISEIDSKAQTTYALKSSREAS